MLFLCPRIRRRVNSVNCRRPWRLIYLSRIRINIIIIAMRAYLRALTLTASYNVSAALLDSLAHCSINSFPTFFVPASGAACVLAHEIFIFCAPTVAEPRIALTLLSTSSPLNVIRFAFRYFDASTMSTDDRLSVDVYM